MFAEEVAFRFHGTLLNHARFETSEAEREGRALLAGFARRILMNRDQRGNADSFGKQFADAMARELWAINETSTPGAP